MRKSCYCQELVAVLVPELSFSTTYNNYTYRITSNIQSDSETLTSLEDFDAEFFSNSTNWQ